jgi:uncharacterized membrane protein
MTEPNNVTPFRRRPPPKRTGGTGFNVQRPQHKVFLLHALTAAAFVGSWLLSFPLQLFALGAGVGAVAIAQSNRRDGMPWAQTHHEFGIRTLLFGGSALMLISVASFFPLIGGYLRILVPITCLWVLVRTAAAFVRAVLRRPVPNPGTFLV